MYHIFVFVFLRRTLYSEVRRHVLISVALGVLVFGFTYKVEGGRAALNDIRSHFTFLCSVICFSLFLYPTNYLE